MVDTVWVGKEMTFGGGGEAKDEGGKDRLGFNLHHGLEKLPVIPCGLGIELILSLFWSKRQHCNRSPAACHHVQE